MTIASVDSVSSRLDQLGIEHEIFGGDAFSSDWIAITHNNVVYNFHPGATGWTVTRHGDPGEYPLPVVDPAKAASVVTAISQTMTAG